MAQTMYVATDAGMVKARREGGDWKTAGRALQGRHVTCLAVLEDLLLAGTLEGVLRSEDEGEGWRESSTGIAISHLRWLAAHPDRPGLVLAGTEPAAVFRSRDGGRNWDDCPQVAELRKEHGWYLPYSPEAGCVRGFALHGDRAYAAVEQGGVLRSEDAGRSWHLAEGSTGEPGNQPTGPFIQNDVHSVHVHPESADLVTTPTGGGLYRSRDGGKTWVELYDCYCRAAWVDPDDPDHVVFGPADGVSSNGRVEVTTDGGQTWRDASAGLDAPWPEDMVDRFAAVGGELIAVLTDGRLLATRPDALNWRPILPEVQDANAVRAAR